MKIRVLTRPARKIEGRTRRELERPLALGKHWKNGILNLQINWGNFTWHKMAIFDRLLDLYEQEVNTVNSKYYQVNACLLFYLYF